MSVLESCLSYTEFNKRSTGTNSRCLLRQSNKFLAVCLFSHKLFNTGAFCMRRTHKHIPVYITVSLIIV